MRTSRLLGIIMELSRVPSASVAGLAEHFAVSDRTIHRDLRAIHDLGVPIWTRPGPSGGVGLVEGWRSPITGITAPEVQALMVGEAGSRDLGFAEDFSTARLKLLALTGAAARTAPPAEERFLIDNQQWFAPTPRPELLSTVAETVWAARRITIRYAAQTPQGQARRRLLDPLGLVLKTDQWYLVAAHRGTPRTYRVSRIRSVRIHGEPSQTPPAFDLAAYWEQSRTAFEASVHTLPVCLSIPQNSAASLLAAVPGPEAAAALEAAPLEAGRLYVRLVMENVEVASAQLLAVPGAEVHEPASLRQQLYSRARDSACRNAPQDAGTAAPLA